MRVGVPMPLEKAGISFVIMDPAPVIDLFPTVTGATSLVSEPIKASSFMIVLCLSVPS